jgi:hypothetical protein
VTILTWPEAVPIATVNRRQVYRTAEGDFPRVTSVLKMLGLGTEALMRWAAETERSAVLEAAVETFAEQDFGDGVAEYHAAIEKRLGAARKHVKALSEAADIGTQAHQRVQWGLARELGQDLGPEPALSDRSLWAWMAFDDWWRSSGLKAVRVEQPVWDAALGAAGTIDIVAEDRSGAQGIVDIKTSKYIYDEHHIQVATYLHMGRRYADLKWARLVRLPKRFEDPAFEVKELGKLYDRVLTPDQLVGVFRAALTVWQTMIQKPLGDPK